MAALVLAVSLAACSDVAGGVALELEYFGGPNRVSGTVRFPAPVADGVRVALALSETFPGQTANLERANGLANKTVRGGPIEVPWTITGLTDEAIEVFVIVDQNGDLEGPNAGDFGGFYAGTEDAPIPHGGTATVIRVVGDTTGLDFYIPEVVCKAAVGEACVVDLDCRGTTCDAGGSRGHLLVGSCQGTCALVACPPGETAS
jgi:hypothetical protein